MSDSSPGRPIQFRGPTAWNTLPGQCSSISPNGRVRPDLVAKIVRDVPETDNLGVRAALAGIIRALPANLGEPFADRVDRWLTIEAARTVAFPLVDNVIGLFERFATEGFEQAALRVLAALLAPVTPSEVEDGLHLHRDPEARLTYWDLGPTMARLLPTIQKLENPPLPYLPDC